MMTAGTSLHHHQPPTDADGVISEYDSCKHSDNDHDEREHSPLLPQSGESGWKSRSFASLVAFLVCALSALSLVGWHSTPLSSQSMLVSAPTNLKKTNDDGGDANVQKIVYIIRHGEKARDPANETAYMYACLSDRGHSRADHLVDTFLGGGGHRPHDLVVPDGLFSFNYDNGDLDCLEDRVYRTQATLRPLGRALGISVKNRHGAKPNLCGMGTIEDTPGITDDNTTFIHYNHQVCHHPGVTGSVHNFGMCCNMGAAAAIRRKLFEDSTTTSAVLVAWEHANIGYLAGALMTNDIDNNIAPRDLDVAEFISTNPVFRDMMDWPDASFDAIWALWFDPETQNFVKIDTATYVQGFGD